MSITLGGAGLPMPKNLSDYKEAFSARHCLRCEGVPQIMNAKISKASERAHALPWLLNADERRPGPIARQYVSIARHPRQPFQDRHRAWRQIKVFGTGLAVWQPGSALSRVDPIPAQRQDFAQAGASEDQQAERSDSAPVLGRAATRHPRPDPSGLLSLGDIYRLPLAFPAPCGPAVLCPGLCGALQGIAQPGKLGGRQ
jgi:hypothetical protein